MKECKFCGMPLSNDTEMGVCDFCKNDDGAEIFMSSEDDYEYEEE